METHNIIGFKITLCYLRKDLLLFLYCLLWKMNGFELSEEGCSNLNNYQESLFLPLGDRSDVIIVICCFSACKMTHCPTLAKNAPSSAVRGDEMAL